MPAEPRQYKSLDGYGYRPQRWDSLCTNRISGSRLFYGCNRKGNNLYANCLLALDAATGKKLWHYQLVHHDIWDRDPPAPPNLMTITRKGPDGRPIKVDVVALVTKQGFTFVFDRVTGKPVFPIKEVVFLQEVVRGEKARPTQPIPQWPAPLVRQAFTEKELNPFAADRNSLLNILKKSKYRIPMYSINW
ncbi:hypothetical protein LZG71_20685 [Dyadobacter sp. CY312]|nr:hypothetical protein [Dyadobacter sp. CY312]MCE7042818.1 hypothetical protein [Dyadobacter sp. CY312]